MSLKIEQPVPAEGINASAHCCEEDKMAPLTAARSLAEARGRFENRGRIRPSTAGRVPGTHCRYRVEFQFAERNGHW